MADRFTYGTGISATPIDIASAGQRVMQAATREKLLDIEQGRQMASESEKAILEASTPERIKELDRALQDRYEKEFEAHRNKIVEMTAKSGGVLSAPQQRAIKNEREDIIQNIMSDNAALQKTVAVQQVLNDPTSELNYNVRDLAAELYGVQEAIKKGEKAQDPRTLLYKHMKEVPVSSYLVGRYNDLMDSFDIESMGEQRDGVFYFTEKEGEREVDNAIDDLLNRDTYIRSKFVSQDGTEDVEKKRSVKK